MKARLREQALKGYRGWDKPANDQRILGALVKHAPASLAEQVDTANLGMILWLGLCVVDGTEHRAGGVLYRRCRRGVAAAVSGYRSASQDAEARSI